MVDKKVKDWEYVSETVIFVGYMPRTTPFGVYSFFVSIIGGKALGGFSAVSGSQIKVAPYVLRFLRKNTYVVSV
jgi:hypothetical protein